MEDPTVQDEERQRRAEAAMEDFLRAQENQDAAQDMAPPEAFPDDEPIEHEEQDEEEMHLPGGMGEAKPFRLSYTTTSFLVAFAMVFYALRTRQQWYLALVFLTSSKWAYIILGNAFVALLITIFSIFSKIFYNGLRLHEAEGLGDFFRWNVTETCLALTMFRSELNVQTGVLFLILVLAKCLHWVADTRESHLRMTQEAVVVHPVSGWPAIQMPHLKLFISLMILQLLDILAVLQCAKDIVNYGPSVSILFAFEGAILLVTVMSSILLWHLHVVDGLFHYWHETTEPGSFLHGWIHPWKDHKATLIFAVEVQAQAAKFLFYLSFFAIVMTYYGLPINLFREVYMSFQELRQRLVAFGKYRKLMANMNRFSNPTHEELEEAGTTCIICRDDMTIDMTKRLPGCGHMFHKSCLREWLVQQQSCPVCRGDIAAMQARERQQRNLAVEQQPVEETTTEESLVEVSADYDDSEDEHEDSHDDADMMTEKAEAPDKQQQQQRQEEKETTGPVETSERRLPRYLPLKKPPPEPAIPAAAVAPVRPLSPATPQKPIMKHHALLQDDDRKPSPIPSHPKEKHVRIIPPHYHAHNDPLRNEGPAFPAFYKVVRDEGAPVYNDGDAVSFVIRVVPFGVVILAHELSWREAEGASRLMIRMPDGWVLDDDVQRIMAVPFDRH